MAINGIQFVGRHPDGVGLALSLGAAVSTGGVSYAMGGAALVIDLLSGDNYGFGIGLGAMGKIPYGTAIDLSYGACRAYDPCSNTLDDILP